MNPDLVRSNLFFIIIPVVPTDPSLETSFSDLESKSSLFKKDKNIGNFIFLNVNFCPDTIPKLFLHY
jgi:hypothetical protein